MCWHIRNSVVCQHFFIPILLLRHPPPPYLSSKKGKISKKFPFFQETFPIFAKYKTDNTTIAL